MEIYMEWNEWIKRPRYQIEFFLSWYLSNSLSATRMLFKTISKMLFGIITLRDLRVQAATRLTEYWTNFNYPLSLYFQNCYHNSQLNKQVSLLLPLELLIYYIHDK